jgi:hypothetical protein
MHIDIVRNRGSKGMDGCPLTLTQRYSVNWLKKPIPSLLTNGHIYNVML